MTVENCTFRDDIAPDEVIYARRGATPKLIRCLIAFNGPGVGIDFHDATVDIQHCNIYGNEGGDWIGPIAELSDSLGNFNRDPEFSNCFGNLTGVRDTSPCLSTNNPAGHTIGRVVADGTSSAKLSVPGDFPTLETAIASAAPGDTIWLAPGCWSASEQRLQAGISLIGTTGDPADVIIDGGSSGTIFICERLKYGVRFEAVTIQNGNAGDLLPAGGAIRCTDTDLSLRSCVIRDCNAIDGGGVHVTNADALEFVNCVFQRNNAISAGGGLLLDRCLTPGIIDCTFHDNSSDWLGGAIHSRQSHLLLESSEFKRNIAQGGAVISTDRSWDLIRSCLFHGNRFSPDLPPEHNGSAFCCDNGSITAFENCTFAHNHFGANGAAITVLFSHVSVLRSIIFENRSGNTVSSTWNGTAQIACCNFFGNPGIDYPKLISQYEQSDGNFSEDPLFIDAENGNFRLQPNSPCAPGDETVGCGLIGAFPVETNR